MPDTDLEEPRTGRAIWSGTITFGLVTIPVALYAGIRPRETAMKMVDPKGRPLGRQYFCPEDGKALEADDIVRGYQTESGKMVVVTDEELASVAPEMSGDIDLQRFVPLEHVPPTFYQRPYILAPAGKSTKAYHLLAQTMLHTGRVGIGTFVMRGNEYLVAIISDGNLLRAETLRFADELRSPADVGLPKRRKASAKDVKQFTRAIQALARERLDPRELSDRYAEELQQVVTRKEKRSKDVVHIAAAGPGDEADPASAEVVDLVNILRQRLSKSAQVATADASAASASDRDDSDAELAKLSKEALDKKAQRLGISGRSKMDKAQLIKAIRRAA